MKTYKIILLLFIAFWTSVREVCSAESQQEESELSFPMPWALDRIWRRPLCVVWNRIQDKRESRKQTSPETLELRTVPYSYAQGMTPNYHDLLYFPIDWPCSALTWAVMLGRIKHNVAHERVHYAEGDVETIDRGHAIFKEFRADVKGLQLWEYDEEAFNGILHGLFDFYLQEGSEPCENIHPKQYETLMCWSVFKLKRQQNPDIVFDDVVRDFVANRQSYQKACSEHPFLGRFLRDYLDSWQGRIGINLSSPEFLTGAVHGSIGAATAPVGYALRRATQSNKAALAGALAAYVVVRNTQSLRLNIEYMVGKGLGRVFNSSLLWDKQAFKCALDEEAREIEKRVDTES